MLSTLIYHTNLSRGPTTGSLLKNVKYGVKNDLLKAVAF